MRGGMRPPPGAPAHPGDCWSQEAERMLAGLKWGAIVCLIVGVLWTLIVKAYW